MVSKKQKADVRDEKDARPVKPAWRVQLGVNWVLLAACYLLFSLLHPLSLIGSCGVPELLIRQEDKSILKNAQYQGADTLAVVALLSILRLAEFPALIGISPKEMRIKAESRTLDRQLGAGKWRYLYATAVAAILLPTAASIKTTDMPWRYWNYINRRDANGLCKEMRYERTYSVYKYNENGLLSVRCCDKEKNQLWRGERTMFGECMKINNNNQVFATLQAKNGIFFEEHINSENRVVRTVNYTEDSRISSIIVPDVGEFSYYYEENSFIKDFFDYKTDATLSADFDRNNLCLRITFPSDIVLNFYYYKDGRRVGVCTDQNNRVIKQAEFDIYGKITKIIDEHGKIITYEYDPSGAIKATYRQNNETDIPYKSVMYDKEGRNYRTETAKGITEYVYQPDGTVSSKDTKFYEVQICTTTFDPNGNPVERYVPLDGLRYFYGMSYGDIQFGTIKTTNDESIGMFQYDKYGNITLEEFRNGVKNVFMYAGNGNCEQHTSNYNTPRAPLLITTYNGYGSIMNSLGAGVSIQYTHNADGSFTANHMDELGQCKWVFSYNNCGLCTEKEYADKKIFYEYADNNRVTETHKALQNGTYNETEVYKYDEQKRVVEILFVGKHIETFEYKENRLVARRITQLGGNPLVAYYPDHYKEFTHHGGYTFVKKKNYGPGEGLI